MSLVDRRAKVRIAVAVVLISAVGLSACGRKGPLEPPPSAAVPEGETQSPVDDGKPDRPFVLDGLI